MRDQRNTTMYWIVLWIAVVVIAVDAGMNVADRLGFAVGEPQSTRITEVVPIDLRIPVDGIPVLLAGTELSLDGSDGIIPIWTPLLGDDASPLPLRVSVRGTVSTSEVGTNRVEIVNNTFFDPLYVTIAP